MIINIKYCGGCNPRFDRTMIEQRLREIRPDNLYRINSQEEADVVIIVCGCSAACVDMTDCNGIYGRFVLWKESSWEELCDFLIKMEEKKKWISH